MKAEITLPDEFASRLGAMLSEAAEKLAAGNRLVDLREATQITRHRRAAIVAAYKARNLAHYIVDGRPQFKVTDLWEWLDKSRVEARKPI